MEKNDNRHFDSQIVNFTPCPLVSSADLMSPPKWQGERENMKKTISFVIPIYNETLRLEKTFKALRNLQMPNDFLLEEIIFVNDGSIDNSEFRILNSKLYSKKHFKIKLISYKENKGKGYAVKQGMLNSFSDYTFVFDADISTPLSEINKFVPFMKKDTDVIIGTRKNGKSTVVIHQPLIRELLGKGFTIISNVILNTWVTDFTCGFKAFSKKSKNIIFAKSQVDRWGYDAETIFIAKKNSFTISEVAVVWANDPRSKVNVLKDIFSSFKDLIDIRKNDLLGIYEYTYLAM